MDCLLSVLYKLILICLFLAVTIFLGQYVWCQVRPTNKIVVVVEGQGGETLVSRWQSLIRPVSLQNFYEITTPVLPDVFSTKHDDALDVLKLTVKGVDVGGLISSLRTMLAPTVHQVNIKIVSEGQKKHLEMRLEYRGKPLKTWYRSSENPEGEGDLEDFALFQLVHYLYFDPECKPSWRKSFQPQTPFPSPQALASYYNGLRQLDSYLQFRQQKDLEDAIKQFRALRAEMPAFANGLMLLGLALAENRDEEEAAGVFQSALDQYREVLGNLENEPPFPGGGAEILQTKLVCCQIRLWQATSIRKQYGTQSNHTAVTKLNDLIKEMRKEKEDLALKLPRIPGVVGYVSTTTGITLSVQGLSDLYSAACHGSM